MLFDDFHKGINIGGWLSQYEFVLDQPFTDTEFNVHLDSFITEADLKQIASWGFDHVRLPLSGYFLFDRETLQLNKKPLYYIDQCISWCKNNNLNLILDLHDLWGNVYGAMDTPMPLLTDSILQSYFFGFWERLAEHCKEVTGIQLMFELFNEVSDASGYLWGRMYKEVIKRIRKIDSERLILVGSNCQNSVAYLTQLDLAADPFVVYNFHYYDPQVFTHQKAHFSEDLSKYNRTVTYPGDISDFVQFLKENPEYQMKYSLVGEETKNDKALMDRLLKNAVDFVQYSGCQLYCGEFGVIDSAPPEEAVKWIKDFLSVLEINRIGHAMWNYKALDFGLIDRQGDVVSEFLLNAIIEINEIYSR